MEPVIKLLLVDDEPFIIKQLKKQLGKKKQLENNEVYDIHVAESAAEALTILERNNIDVVISDILMESMDGFELVKKINDKGLDLQCILITAHGTNDANFENKISKLGISGYLCKPFDIAELDVAIKTAMNVLQMKRTITAALPATEVELREALFDTLSFALRYWERTTRKSKVELAQESELWNISYDSSSKKGRARTLERYLRLKSIPQKPDYRAVLDTGEYILSNTPSEKHPESRAKIQKKIDNLKGLARI